MYKVFIRGELGEEVLNRPMEERVSELGVIVSDNFKV